MRTLSLALFALAGCAVEPDAAPAPEGLADAQASVPLPMDLSWDHDLYLGRATTFTVTGAPANRTVVLLATTNVGGVPACPAAIAPDCLDIAAPFVVLGNRRSNANGVVTFTVNVPANLAFTEVDVQAAAVDGAVHYTSDPNTLPVVAAPIVTNIQDLRRVPPAIDTFVEVSGVVTAVRSNGFALQQPGAIADAAVWVYTSTLPEPQVGDVVSAAGNYVLFDNNGALTTPNDTLTEVNVAAATGGDWWKTGTAALPPAVPVSIADMNDPVRREELESMLVRLTDPLGLTVENDPNAPGAFDEFFVYATPGGAHAEIDNEFFALGDNLPGFSVGDGFSSITGILFFSFDEYKIAPRDLADAAGFIDVP